MSDKVHNVVFLRKWDVYQVGERAGFTKQMANHLFSNNFAKPYEPLPEAHKGDDIPESGMTPEELKHVRASQRILRQKEMLAEKEQREKEEKRAARKGIFPGGGKPKG